MDLRKPTDLILAIVAVVGTTMSTWFFLEYHFWPREDLMTRLLMSESKRHGEITAHYRKLIETGDLMEAEKWRAELAEREQKRLHEILMGKSDDGQ